MWPSCGWASCDCHPAGSWVPRAKGAELRGRCRGGEWCAQPFGEHRGCLARLLGDGAGIRLKAVGCPALSRQTEKKLPGSSWHRGRKKEESIWGEREGKKDLRLKKKKKSHPFQIHGFALLAIPTVENIPKGIFHYCSATVVSLLKTFWMCIFNSCWKKFFTCEL